MNTYIKQYTANEKKLLSKIFADYNFSNWKISRNFPLINPLQSASIGFKTGIQNLGNTCYINSVLQCLNGSPSFIEFIFSITEKYNSIVLCDEFKLIACYSEYVCNAISRENTVETTSFNAELINVILQIISPHFNINPNSNAINYDQQDAHEFLVHFTAYLAEAFDQIMFIYMTDIRRPHPDIDQFDNMLLIKLVIKRKCKTCGTSVKHEVQEKCLNVEISSDSTSVADCLENYFAVETMSDPLNLPNCAKCKKKTAAYRQVRISTPQLPKLLIIQLIRFSVIILITTNIIYSTFFI
jgi:uncharacterized UBP type Zn finger protein